MAEAISSKETSESPQSTGASGEDPMAVASRSVVDGRVLKPQCRDWYVPTEALPPAQWRPCTA